MKWPTITPLRDRTFDMTAMLVLAMLMAQRGTYWVGWTFAGLGAASWAIQLYYAYLTDKLKEMRHE